MKSNLKEVSHCQREIEIEIEAQKVSQELEKILSDYSRKAKIPGFRPGKAPKDIVKRMFYPEIKDSLINSLAPKALSQEIKSLHLNLIGSPVINDIYFKEGEPLRFKAKFEIWPEITLPDYNQIKVKKKKITVSADEINKSLEELQLKSSQYVPVEGRGVASGDYVVVEIKGKDLKTKRFLPTEKIAVIADDPQNDKTFNQKLLGLKSDQEATFTISYPKDFKNKRLSGKTIEYSVKIISIKEKKVPTINDDFAKDIGEYNNLKDLKKEIRSNLLAAKERESKKQIAEEVIKNIAAQVKVELPESMVAEETAAIVQKKLSSQPLPNLKEEEVAKIKAEAELKARENILNQLILSKIAEKEKLIISEEEINQELEAIAKANNYPLAKVIEAFNQKGRRQELKETLLLKKTVDFLADKAIIE